MARVKAGPDGKAAVMAIQASPGITSAPVVQRPQARLGHVGRVDERRRVDVEAPPEA